VINHKNLFHKILYTAALAVVPALAQTPWVAGDYVGYMYWQYPPSAIDFTSLTQVNVFSVIPNNDGTLNTTLFIDAVNGPLVAKNIATLAHAAGKKAVLVIGGAGTGAQFQSATSATYMNAFVQNLTNTVQTWGFDGVDIDWEPIATSDYATVLQLIGKLRTALPGKMITADVGWLSSNFALSSTDAQFYALLAAAVDQMNIMSYGMADAWGGWAAWHSSAITGEGGNHPSSVASSVALYRAAGVPAAKLGVGIGFYGSCWKAPVTAPLQAVGASYIVASDNTMGFANIMNSYYNAANYHMDQAAQAPYLSFASATGPAGCTFISYENEASVALKAQYVKANGLGGALLWQLNEAYNPAAADPNSLLHAVGKAFLNGTTATASTASVASNLNPAAVGQAVTFTAHVSGSDGGVPAGTVTFNDGATPIGSATLSAGAAAVTVSNLTAGTHSITASYGGSATYAMSVSAALTETVNGTTTPATATTLKSSLNPAAVGQAVTFTATVAVVAPGTGTPAGTVTFKDGATTLGSVALGGGVAALTVSNLTAGAHSITASYGGSTAYAASVSAALTESVSTKPGTTVALGSSVNPAVYGQAVTFTATVAVVAPGTGTPAGTMTFKDGGTTLGSATLSGGKAALTVSTLAVGAHSITASYGGSTAHAASVSAAVSQTVGQSATTTSLTSSKNPARYRASITFTATVKVVAPGTGTPVGVVDFYDGTIPMGSAMLNNGKATVTTTTLGTGNRSIKAVYTGTANYGGSNSSVLTQIVN